MMHIDYAIELVERYEADSYIKGDSFKIISMVSAESELLALIDKHGDDKHRSIAATVRDIQSSNNRYRKVTDGQRKALARHLLELFGTHRAVLAAAYGKTEQEMFGEAMEAEEAPAKAEPAAQMSNEYVAKAEEAKRAAEFMGLPALTGSPKQIAWAEQIRQKYIEWAEDGGINSTPVVKSRKARTSRFWIDNRNNFRGLEV